MIPKYQFIRHGKNFWDKYSEDLKQIVKDRNNIIYVSDLVRFVPKIFKMVINDILDKGQMPLYEIDDLDAISFDFHNQCWRSIINQQMVSGLGATTQRVSPFGKGMCDDIDKFLEIFTYKSLDLIPKEKLFEKTLLFITHDDQFDQFSLMISKIKDERLEYIYRMEFL